ncbi:hypothetical protein EMIT0194MI4_50290 [Pseudomonas sp. IT-194MI4]
MRHAFCCTFCCKKADTFGYLKKWIFERRPDRYELNVVNFLPYTHGHGVPFTSAESNKYGAAGHRRQGRSRCTCCRDV